MNSLTEILNALRDFIQLHFKQSRVWLPALVALVAALTLVVLLRGILIVRSGPGWVPPEFRHELAYKAIICWAISTVSAYVGGFIMGRLYQPAP